MNTNQLKLKELNKAIRLNPNDPKAYFHRASFYLKLEKYVEALHDINIAIELHRSAHYICIRGYIYKKLGRNNDALKEFNKAIEMHPEDYALPYESRGDLLFEKQYFQRAINDYNKSLEIKPRERIYYNRGNAYYHLCDYISAKLDLDKAIEFNSTKIKYYTFRSMISIEMKEYEGALNDYSKCIELEPTQEHYYWRGIIYLQYIKNYKAAIKDFNKAIELDDTKPKYHIGKGNALSELEENEQALECYNKALTLDTENASVYYRRGFLFLKMKRYDLALNNYKRNLELAPNSLASLQDVSKIYLMKNNLAEAEFHLIKAWEVGKYSTISIARYLGHLAIINKNKRLAMHWFQKSFSLHNIPIDDFKDYVINEFTFYNLKEKNVSENFLNDILKGIDDFQIDELV